MNLTPEQLEKDGYEKLEELSHDELLPFVRKTLKYNTFYRWAYIGFNLLFLAMILFVGYRWKQAGYVEEYDSLASAFSFGFVFSLLLIPLHEYIHVLAYRYVGAKETSYDVVWKKFYFMALAHRFVADEREFRIVALAPFVTITILCFVLFFAFNDPVWRFFFLSLTLMHASFCSGDFGMMSFVSKYGPGVVTYDDVVDRKSFFFVNASQKAIKE